MYNFKNKRTCRLYTTSHLLFYQCPCRDTRLEENERLLLPDTKRDNASIVPRRVVSTKTANRQSKIFGIKQSQPLRYDPLQFLFPFFPNNWGFGC